MTSPMSETSLIYKWNESNEACREGNILPAASGCDKWGSRAAGTGPASWWSSGYRRGGRTAQWRRSPSRRGTPDTHCPRSPTAAWLQTWPLPVQPFTETTGRSRERRLPAARCSVEVVESQVVVLRGCCGNMSFGFIAVPGWCNQAEVRHRAKYSARLRRFPGSHAIVLIIGTGNTGSSLWDWGDRGLSFNNRYRKHCM